jgi:hypothetical protein
MKLIIDAEVEELDYVMDLIKEALPTFDRHEKRIGWGWHFQNAGGRSFFIRRTKGGFSASPTKRT